MRSVRCDPVGVVVRGVRAQGRFEMSPREDEQAVSALTANGPDRTLGEHVRTRRLDRRSNERLHHAPLDLASRSWTMKRDWLPTSCSPITRFRACCAAHAPLRFAVTAARARAWRPTTRISSSFASTETGPSAPTRAGAPDGSRQTRQALRGRLPRTCETGLGESRPTLESARDRNSAPTRAGARHRSGRTRAGGPSRARWRAYRRRARVSTSRRRQKSAPELRFARIRASQSRRRLTGMDADLPVRHEYLKRPHHSTDERTVYDYVGSSPAPRSARRIVGA
jgi:hypothetical protein